MQQRLFQAVLALALLALGSGAALAERVRIPGTRITIDAPPQFTLSQRFPGVENAATMSSILINELPAPIATMTEGFTAANLASRGMTLKSAEAISVSGRAATLYHLTQSADGTQFEKWLAALGDGTSSVLIVGTFPAAMAARMSAPVRAAVLSTELNRDPSAGRFDGLRYRITAPAGLEIQHRLQNMLLLAAPGSEDRHGPEQPIAVVGASHSPVAIPDLAAFARARLGKTAQITGLEDIQGAAVEIDGRPAYEIVAVARDQDSGAPLAVYQMVLLDGRDYFVTQGLVGAAGAAEYLPRFRALAQSMTLQ